MGEPLFSVVIATFQRPAQLVDCLQSLAQQDYPHDRFEVIVVDDGGGLDEGVVRAALAGRLEALVLHSAHGGPAAARNTGVQHAHGRWLYFLDDDCRLAPEGLARLQARVERHPLAAIAGACADAHPGNLWSAASQAQVDAVVSYYNRDAEHATSGASSHLAVPRAAFRELGGFDASFRTAEDRDFLDRWVRSGRALVYAPEVLVTHLHPCRMGVYLLRNIGYGRGAWQFAMARRRAGVEAQRVDRGFYRHLLTHPLRTRPVRAHPPRALLIVAGLILARAAYAVGYWAARCATTDR